MSIIGILGSNLFAGVVDSFRGNHGAAHKFEQIKEQFQQLGQDLQSGNLAQAKNDYTTLSSEFPGANQTGAPAAAAPTTTTGATPTGTTSAAQEFAQSGQDLQSGNLQGAQQDFTKLQQAGQQNGAQQIEGHHRHGHNHNGGGFQSASVSSSAQQSISQAFGTLGQDLQSGNLSEAQSAFATLQNDLQQIGGVTSSGSGRTSPTSSASGSSTGATLNVSA